MEEEQIGGGVRKKDKGNESASQFLGFPIMSQFTPTTFPSDTTFLANNLTMTRSGRTKRLERFPSLSQLTSKSNYLSLLDRSLTSIKSRLGWLRCQANHP